jgi:excisionase family DNA binding protein
MRPLLTLREVAGLLAVPERTLYAWRHERTGPPVTKVGKYLRYDQDALERWLAERTDGAVRTGPPGTVRVRGRR